MKFRMIRTAMLKNASMTTKAIGWGTELTSYFNETYGLKMQTGMGVLNKAEMYWILDFDSMSQIEETWGKMLQDKKYWDMIDNAKDFWVDGSLQDNLVTILD
jgi:hypothetical protein